MAQYRVAIRAYPVVAYTRGGVNKMIIRTSVQRVGIAEGREFQTERIGVLEGGLINGKRTTPIVSRRSLSSGQDLE